MDFSTFSAVVGFALAATITPGPNNIMVMASGVNFGVPRTMPHLLGITVGVSVTIGLIGVGLAVVLDAYPILHTGLKIAAAVYLLFLAWKVATAAPPESRSSNGRPLTFLQAATFQWVNPKVLALGLSAVTLYAPDHSFGSVALVAGTFAVIGFLANSIWAWAGTVLRRWLSNRTRLRVFNGTMALLLIASLYPVLTALAVR